MEKNKVNEYQRNYYNFLLIEKFRVEDSFDWLSFIIDDRVLKGNGILQLAKYRFEIELFYSPFFKYRFDRIYILSPKVVFNSKIHLYSDLSLCLYHPIIDSPNDRIMPLVKIIPWITEWCIHFQEWKKYGVWLGKEIAH